MTKLRTLLMAALLITLAGCITEVPDTNNSPNNGTNNDTNNGTNNNGTNNDTNNDTDNNGTTCPPCEDSLVCDETSGNCVDCLESADCFEQVCNTATNACVTCLTNPQEGCEALFCVGENEEASCEECLDNSACTDVNNSVCTENACTPCVEPGDCGHLPDTPSCSTNGKCVECTSNADCSEDTTACLPNGTCGDIQIGTLTNCQTCEADDECIADHRCIPMEFGGTQHGNYCLKQLSTGCTNPFRTTIESASVSGEQSLKYCGIAQADTTCEATLALLGDDDCTKATEVDTCGTLGLIDGLCETVNGAANKCTYTCGDPIECPSNRPCNNNYCGG